MAHLRPMVAEYAVLVNNEKKFLMIRLWDEHRQTGGWHFPGGRIDETEESVDALKRELLEEIGVRGKVICPVHTQIFDRPNHTKYAVFFLVKTSSTEITLETEEKSKEWKWFSFEERDSIEYWQPFYKDVIEKAYVFL